MSGSEVSFDVYVMRVFGKSRGSWEEGMSVSAGLEVAAGSVASALAAQEGGAMRGGVVSWVGGGRVDSVVWDVGCGA